MIAIVERGFRNSTDGVVRALCNNSEGTGYLSNVYYKSYKDFIDKEGVPYSYKKFKNTSELPTEKLDVVILDYSDKDYRDDIATINEVVAMYSGTITHVLIVVRSFDSFISTMDRSILSKLTNLYTRNKAYDMCKDINQMSDVLNVNFVTEQMVVEKVNMYTDMMFIKDLILDLNKKLGLNYNISIQHAIYLGRGEDTFFGIEHVYSIFNLTVVKDLISVEVMDLITKHKLSMKKIFNHMNHNLDTNIIFESKDIDVLIRVLKGIIKEIKRREL